MTSGSNCTGFASGWWPWRHMGLHGSCIHNTVCRVVFWHPLKQYKMGDGMGLGFIFHILSYHTCSINTLPFLLRYIAPISQLLSILAILLSPCLHVHERSIFLAHPKCNRKLLRNTIRWYFTPSVIHYAIWTSVAKIRQ